MYSPKKIAKIVKSITAREIFKRCPFVKKELWGGEFWSDGNESIIKDYFKNQGDGSYKKFKRDSLLRGFLLYQRFKVEYVKT